MRKMVNEVFQQEIPWHRLQLCADDIYLSMGKDYVPSEEIEKSINELKEEIASFCHPRYLYTYLKALPSTRNHIQIGDVTLHTGAVITPYLKDADYYAVFVATAGREFESFQHDVKRSGDIVREFLLDSLGTAVAEAVVREVCNAVENDMRSLEYGVSYPYSPGYCGWHVSQQQLLFPLLPDEPCGIRLHESSLMSPIKSVSGVIAIGEHVRKLKYGCELCGKKDCYKNRNK